MRGRSRNKGPNPLTRSYESNGPDVKIRGTAQHIADKYSQLSRDAQASGDPVAAENYLQHAEHYYRLIAAAQEQYRQQFGGFQRDEDGEEGDEEGGFGGPAQDRNQGGDDFGDAPNFPQGGYEPRGDRQNQRFDRGDRQQNPNRQRFDRGGERFDRNQERGERYDRQGGGYDRQSGGYDRPNGEQRFDRSNGGDRYDRQDRPERQDRQERQDRPERQDRRFGRDDRPRDERGGREGFAPREGRPERDSRRESRPAVYGNEGVGEEEPDAGGNLPAFLTNPVRPAISVDEVAESAGLAPAPAPAPAAEADAPEATGIRPRRRRTRKADPAPEGVDEAAGGA